MEKITNPALQRRRKWLAASCALLLAGSFAGWHLASWPIRLAYPGEQSYAEGTPLAEMVHLREGIPIYGQATGGRFDTANYGPLYYLLGARLVNPQRLEFLPLRWLSILGILGCAAGCGLLSLWLARSYLAAALAPLLFLSYAFVSNFASSGRADSLALFLCFGGLLVAYSLRDRGAMLWSALPMLVGFFYKQQFVAFPLAVLLYLLLEKRYRLAIEFVGLLAVGGLSLIALFQFVVFPGQAFLDHYLLYNALPFSAHYYFIGGVFFGLVLLVPLLVGVEFLRSCPDRLLACCVGSSLSLNLMAVGREGSDANYFLESALILCPLFAALIARRISESGRTAELLILLGISLFLGQWFAPPPPRKQDFLLDRAVQNYLRQHFSPQTPALGFTAGALVQAGLDTPISNMYHFTWLVRQGVLSERDLLANLKGRFYGVIAVNFDLEGEKEPYWRNYYMTESMRAAILANYQLAASLEMPQPEKFRSDDRFYVWVPRP